MKLSIKFNPSAVMAGQKSSVLNALPQLIVKSTPGQFTITSPVSKALNIAVGENVMFCNNISSIEQILNDAPDEIVNYANENGWDLNTREGHDAFVKDQTIWYIAKGVPLYKNGKAVLATTRVAKEDKLAYIKEHGLELIANMTEEEKAAFAEAKNLVGADDEALAASLVAEDIPSPTFHASSGSKTAATAKATGIGLQLNFTDTAIWDFLKADLGSADEKKAVNRVFDVNFDEPTPVPFNNGKENLTITAYPLVFSEDKAPMTRGGNGEEAED